MSPSPPYRSAGAGKKKEPFSPTLTSIDSQTPEAPASPRGNGFLPWDTETDHMLSYFLGGDQKHEVALPDFMTSGGTKDMGSSAEESDGALPPPTPVMKFYSYAGKPPNQSQSAAPPPSALASSSSSSSSISSMTANLVSGGSVLPQAGNMSTSGFSKDSPVSPAEAIGSGVENLMLPPAPRRPSQGSAMDTGAYPGPQPSADPQHLAWLRDINAIARANGKFPAAPHQHQHVVAAAAASVFPGTAPAWAVQNKTTPERESEEKRALRLQRNRESARKSRRMKKERLLTSEKKVNNLHAQISEARQAKIMSMVDGLRTTRQDNLTTMNVDSNGLLFLVRNSGPCSEVFQSVAEFQGNTMTQVLFPRYQSILHWFAMQETTYFTLGKTEYLKNGANNGKAKSLAARLSSKQVGESLSKDETDTGPDIQGTRGEDDVRPKRTSHINDSARMWPLFCYEMSFSVEQEEKFLATHQRLHRREDNASSRNATAAARKAAVASRNAIDSLCSLVSKREESTIAGILSPQQAARYQGWLGANRSRCREKVASLSPPMESLPQGQEASMEYITARLSEVLQIRDSRP